MAAKTVSPPPAIERESASTEHERRLSLAYEASGQIDALIELLRREQRTSSDHSVDVVLSTLLRRVDQLNGVVFAVLARDDQYPTDELRTVVDGGRIDREVAHG